jgi:hypothetical protein
MERTIKDFMNDQDSVRRRFAQVSKKDFTTWKLIAKEIGISPVTLMKFVMDGDPIRIRPLIKIEEWIVGREKQCVDV